MITFVVTLLVAYTLVMNASFIKPDSFVHASSDCPMYEATSVHACIDCINYSAASDVHPSSYCLIYKACRNQTFMVLVVL